MQTQSTLREKTECDQPDHWTPEFFGADSAWMLKYADDDECREQPKKDAHDPRNYEGDLTDHEGPPKGDVNRVSFR
jgi:hypothetical protein